MEKRGQKIQTNMQFARRIGSWFLLTLFLFAISLGFGIWGYVHFEHLPLIDATLNASMILGGMGPVDAMKTDGGKLFASFYALYSGLFLVIVGGLLLVPIFHRVLHVFHQED